MLLFLGGSMSACNTIHAVGGGVPAQALQWMNADKGLLVMGFLTGRLHVTRL